MSIAVLGEAIVDLIQQRDGRYEPHLGGSPYNVAIAAARQGGDVSYLSPLSDDRFGDLFAQSLHANGVHHRSPMRSRLPSSLALVTLDDQGQPAYRLYREGIADKDIDAVNILQAVPDGTNIFHTGSLAITPDYLSVVTAVIIELKQRGITISIDINIRDKACSDSDAYRKGVQSLLPLADIVKASDEDLLFFADTDLKHDTDTKSDQATVERLASQFLNDLDQGLLILTTGEHGGKLMSQKDELPFSAKQVGPFVDSIGAGDTFYATFLANLSQSGSVYPPTSISKQRLINALDFATTAAAINVTTAGCNPPTQAEVESVLLASQS